MRHLITEDSSMLSAIGWCPRRNMLRVVFTPSSQSAKGSVYEYQNVTPDLWAKLVAAPSIGSLFTAEIVKQKEAHPFKRIEVPFDGPSGSAYWKAVFADVEREEPVQEVAQ